MKIKFISCWFATSYGAYTDSLRQALERQLGEEVGVICSNCGCGEPMEVKRIFQDQRCDYFELPHVYYFKSSNPVKFWLRNMLRQVAYRERAKKYLARAGDAQVLHFQQTLHALGSVTVFNWLRLPSPTARIVTVHELDPYQVDFPKSNLTYNLADRILVHAHELKEKLITYGVDAGKIDIIKHGTDIQPLPQGPRQGIIFYGGHFLGKGKGLETLFQAMVKVREKLGASTPTLTIHGHYGDTPGDGVQMMETYALGNVVRWLNQIPHDDAVEEYRKALVCVLPYTGSFAGLPASLAMANGVPVIATRRAGLPEHLGDAAVWIEENDSDGLATAILKLLDDTSERERLAQAGRIRAERLLSWDVIADKTLASYRAALDNKTNR